MRTLKVSNHNTYQRTRECRFFPQGSWITATGALLEWPASYTRWPYATPSRGNPLYQAGWDGHTECLPVSMVGELADVTEGNCDTMFGKVSPDVTGGVAAIHPTNINISFSRAVSTGVTPGWLSCRRHVTLATRIVVSSSWPLGVGFPPPDNRGEVLSVRRWGIRRGWGWGTKTVIGATRLHWPITSYSSDWCWGRSITLSLLVSRHLGWERHRLWRGGGGGGGASGVRAPPSVAGGGGELSRILKVLNSVSKVDDHEEKVGHVCLFSVMWWFAIVIPFNKNLIKLLCGQFICRTIAEGINVTRCRMFDLALHGVGVCVCCERYFSSSAEIGSQLGNNSQYHPLPGAWITETLPC